MRTTQGKNSRSSQSGRQPVNSWSLLRLNSIVRVRTGSTIGICSVSTGGTRLTSSPAWLSR
jgi:hypothetical protein